MINWLLTLAAFPVRFVPARIAYPTAVALGDVIYPAWRRKRWAAAFLILFPVLVVQ
ncbi:MAG: hypothetical protein AB1566_03740 [Chloroflexota bacterium]